MDEEFLIDFISTREIKSVMNSPYWNDILKNSRCIFYLLNHCDFHNFELLSSDIRENPIVAISMAKSSFAVCEHFPDAIWKNNLLVLQILDISPHNFRLLPQELKENKELVYWFCNRWPNNQPLRWVPDRWKQDNKLAHMLLSHNPLNFIYLSSELRNNVDLYETASSKPHMQKLFLHAGNEILDNEQYALKAINYSYSCYKHISMRLRNDKIFFMKVLNLYPNALEDAEDHISKDYDIAVASIERDIFNIKYVNHELFSNINFAAFCFNKDSDYFYSDEIFNLWSKDILKNKKFITDFIDQLINHNTISILPQEILNDEQIMIYVCENNEKFIKFCGYSLQTNIKFLDKLYINWLHTKNKFSYSDNLNFFQFLSSELFKNTSFVLSLYHGFTSVFFEDIMPLLIKHYPNLYKEMNNFEYREKEAIEWLEKISLNQKLEQSLPISNVKIDDAEIHKL